jgi:hypothetical protein
VIVVEEVRVLEAGAQWVVDQEQLKVRDFIFPPPAFPERSQRGDLLPQVGRGHIVESCQPESPLWPTSPDRRQHKVPLAGDVSRHLKVERRAPIGFEGILD